MSEKLDEGREMEGRVEKLGGGSSGTGQYKASDQIKAKTSSRLVNNLSDADNSFAYRIQVSQSLYEKIVHFAGFIDQMENDLRTLMQKHNILVSEFFEEILENNVAPRLVQISELGYEVRQYDVKAVETLIQRYQQAIRGMEKGQSAAKQFISQVNLPAARHLGGLSAALGNGDPRDFDTQLAVAKSIRAIFEALLAELESAGRAYDACVRDHDKIMLQDFNAFIQNNVEPRLHTISNIWRNVRDKDITAIDDIIARLMSVSP